jgi:large subunit ribosomal protein L10
MTKQEKNDVIEVLKGKFTQYNNFYITDTESLSVEQVTNLRRHCFDKQVEMKVAKNTLIKKALESIDSEKYSGVFDSLHKVTALMFSENPKDPAVILSGFRKANNNEKPELKAAFINGDVFVGDNQLKALTQIKTKNELIGEVIGLLQSPIQRVIGALQNRENATGAATEEAAAPVAETATETPVAETPATEAPAAPAAEGTEEAPKAE